MRANGEAVLAAVASVGFLRDQLDRTFRGKGQYLGGATDYAASAAVAQFWIDRKSKIREIFHGAFG
jgi:hypothetical protein